MQRTVTVTRTSCPLFNRVGATRHFQTGFTLVETVIAVLVFSIVSAGLYGILSHARKQSTRADIRLALNSQAETILRMVQEDLKFTASASMQINQNGGLCSFEQHVGNNADDVAQVTYQWQKPKLFRKAVYKGTTTLKMLSGCVESFVIEQKPRPSLAEDDFDLQPEQVKVALELSLLVPGFNEPMTRQQHVMATMRELASQKYDPHWRDVGNLKGVFSTYGNLLASLGEDAKMLIEDITSTIDGVIAQIEGDIKNALNQPNANLADAKNQLRNALSEITRAQQDVASSLADMDKQMSELPKKIFKRKFKSLFGDKDKALKRVQEAYYDMKTVGQMDINKLKKAADPFELDSCFEDFFTNKLDALKNRDQLDAQKEKVSSFLDKLENDGIHANLDDG